MRVVAKKTFGTKLRRGNVYVARLLNIDPPEMSRDDQDVTDHDSPDGFKEFIPGMKEAGEVPIEGHLIPTDETQTSLLAAIDIDDPEPWAIEFPSNPMLTVSFDGYVKSFKVGEASLDGAMTFNAVIKVTGKPVISVDKSAGLTSLTVSGAAALDLAPAFSSKQYEYFVTAPNADDAIKVTPAATGTITVNGITVATGATSGDITLTEGAITFITIQVKEPDKAGVTYILKVYREESE